MENLDENNLKASIQITTDGTVTVGETRGHYRDIIALLGMVILNLHEQSEVGLEEIGEDLNKVVKELERHREENEHD